MASLKIFSAFAVNQITANVGCVFMLMNNVCI